MKINPEFAAPCGLYCGVCGIHITGRDRNEKFQQRLVSLYQGNISGKGALSGVEHLTKNEIKCSGCLSGERFTHCRQCEIRNCVKDRGYEGCHECDEVPCVNIEEFPMTIGKRVILRAIPHRREVGTEKWIQAEEARYICPECGNRVFRGVVKCNQCRAELALD